MTQPAPPPPNTNLRHDPAWWVSLVLTVLSAVASFYGVPIGDPAVQAVVQAVVNGLVGVGAAITAIRTIALKRNSGS